MSGLANGRELARSQSGRDVISGHVKQHEEERQRLFEEIQNVKAKIKEVALINQSFNDFFIFELRLKLMRRENLSVLARFKVLYQN